MLVCCHCKSQSVVYDREFVAGTGWVDRPRCMKCGREKFTSIEISKNIKSDSQRDHSEDGTSPMQVGETLKKEEPMAFKRQCKFEGCDKKELAGGYCYKHFQVVNGHKYVPGQINHKGGNVKMPEKPANDVEKPERPEAVTGTTGRARGDAGGVNEMRPVYLPAELYDEIATMAERQFRPIDMQVQYLIHTGMQIAKKSPLVM